MAMVNVSKDTSGRIIVAFQYDPSRVAKVKTIEGYRWYPDKKHWSFPDSDGTLEKILKVFEGEEIRVDPALRVKVPSLLDRVREAVQTRHDSRRTGEAYVAWIKRFVFFHDKRHPTEMGAPEIARFLSSLATDGHVSPSTQNQALSALLFLYKEVLGQDLPWVNDIVHAKRPRRLPVVLTREEVGAVLAQLRGVPRLMVTLLCGAGLRLLECARLRVKDVDVAMNQIIVREGKGNKDRAGAPWAQGFEYDDGLHARPEPRSRRCPKPGGQAGADDRATRV